MGFNSGNNTYSGGTTISSGTLVLRFSGTLGSSPRITVASRARLTFANTVSFALGDGQTLAGSRQVGLPTGGSLTLAGTLEQSGGTIQLVVVPRPQALLLAAAGLAAAAWAARRRPGR